tara:strand:- start:222 stop:452 length:231 start_codon:yes stop_codon:yes gene_type:complete
MAYVYGKISKFKRVEAAIRKTLKSHRNLIDVIDNAMPKNKEEIEMLQAIRKECDDLHKRSYDILVSLYDKVEKPPE